MSYTSCKLAGDTWSMGQPRKPLGFTRHCSRAVRSAPAAFSALLVLSLPVALTVLYTRCTAFTIVLHKPDVFKTHQVVLILGVSLA